MSMKNKNIEDFYPLSPIQQGILFHTIAAPKSGVYFEQSSWTLKGNFNIAAFQQAWQQIVERHSILRTGFIWEGLKEPVQVVHRQVTLPCVLLDLRHLSPVEQQKQLETFLESDIEQGFDLTHPPLMRLTIHHLSENFYQFTRSHHHILLDGWSSARIYKEVFECYKAFSNGQDIYLEPTRSYRDYIVWLQQQNLSQAEAYWQQLFKGFTAPTRLWVDKGSGLPITKYGNNQHEIKLGAQKTAALQRMAQQHQLTLNTLVQGAWALLLSRYSGQSDIVFGATTSGRPPALAKADSMVGLFVNTLPVRVQVLPEEFLLPWLKQIQTQQIETRQYEYSPLVKVQGWSEVPKGLPLFESIVAFENYPVDASVRKLDLNLEIKSFSGFNKTNYPLNLLVMPGEELLLKIIYDDNERFSADTINRMLKHLKTLLEGMVANSQQRLKDLPLLTAPEQHQLLVEWNNTQAEYPQHQCIHQLFEAQVERTPDAVAVVFEDQQLTYCKLNARSNQLAHYLQKLGVGAEVLVGICVERSLDMLIGLLAILKAGGAYVPLDPTYPKERLAFMLENSQPSVLLTQQHLVESLPNHKAKLVCSDSNWELFAQQRIENPGSDITPDNLAYVIYTSGSTGRPKGAMNTHRGICNRLVWMQDTYQLTAADKVLQKTPFSFDVSVWEFFWPLMTGARLVVAQPEGHRDTNYLVDLITQQEISTIHFVPSMLQVFLEAENLETGKCLKRVMASGEALPDQLQKRFFNRLGAELHNLYGPTEAGVDVTYWACVHQSSTQENTGIDQNTVPIGHPIANIQIYLLDEHLNPVPVGLTGEVYIGGVGVGRGYLNSPELTAQRFIPNPFSSQSATRLYKTGDLARYLPNGEIEYIGRIDHQVKVRGFRIEPGEIEAYLRQHPKVRETVVVVCSDSTNSQRLVAYVVPQKEQTLTFTELRDFLESKLPKYMVPAAFVMLQALPLTPNGKVDRKALPTPDTARPELEAVYQPPQNEVEKTIANIWQESLHVEDVGIHDNFFELGGHSLLLLQVHSKLQNIFQRDFPLVEMFQYPTISHLARYFGQESSEQESFTQHSDRPESRTTSLQRRKQARKEHRAATKQKGK